MTARVDPIQLTKKCRLIVRETANANASASARARMDGWDKWDAVMGTGTGAGLDFWSIIHFTADGTASDGGT